jgi:hypothetical protein
VATTTYKIPSTIRRDFVIKKNLNSTLTNEERTQSCSEFQDRSTTLQIAVINDQMESAGLNIQTPCQNQFNMIEDMSQQHGEQKERSHLPLGYLS